jgi:hypothetical protein
VHWLDVGFLKGLEPYRFSEEWRWCLVFILSAWLDRWTLLPSSDWAASSIRGVPSNVPSHDLFLRSCEIGYCGRTRDDSRWIYISPPLG